MFFFIGALLFVFFFPFILPFLALFIEIKDIFITAAIISGILLVLNISIIRDGLGSDKKWVNALTIIILAAFLAGSAYLAATVEEQQVIDLIRKLPFLQKYM